MTRVPPGPVSNCNRQKTNKNIYGPDTPICLVCPGLFVEKGREGECEKSWQPRPGATASILSLLFLHRLEGVREGTAAAALLVGLLAKRLQPPLQRWFRRAGREKRA